MIIELLNDFENLAPGLFCDFSSIMQYPVDRANRNISPGGDVLDSDLRILFSHFGFFFKNIKKNISVYEHGKKILKKTGFVFALPDRQYVFLKFSICISYN